MSAPFSLHEPQPKAMRFGFDRTVCREEYLTPKWILDALGPFDLDPCAPTEDRRPWPTAARHLTIFDNGLALPWAGRVWCNPPYGLEGPKFLRRLADHGDGIALVFARTDTQVFRECVIGRASALLFVKRRIAFCDHRGRAAGSAGAPSMLIAYGLNNAEALADSGIPGAWVPLSGARIVGGA